MRFATIVVTNVKHVGNKKLVHARLVEVTIGSAQGAMLRLQATGVAPAHAILRRFAFTDHQRFELQALEPLFVEGRPVHGGETVTLEVDEWVEIGVARLKVRLKDALSDVHGGGIGRASPRTCVSVLALAELFPQIRFWSGEVEAGGFQDDNPVRDRAACSWELADCVTSDLLRARLIAGEPFATDVTCTKCQVLIDWALENRVEP